jgi:hypothetical protein
MLLKLALIPASLLVASLVARRFGHGIAGVVAGLPMVAAPIVVAVMIDQSSQAVSALAHATLASVPATLAFIAAFAWSARALPWWGCLAAATLSFGALGWTLTGLAWPDPWPQGLAIAAPALALVAMPRAPRLAGGVAVPRGEIALRMAVAVAVGAAILYGADHFPPRVNGLMLAWPVAGSILPSFTLATHGRDATVALLRGFATGLIGFIAFFVVLAALLDTGASQPVAFVLALACAATAAALLQQVRARVAARTAA